MKVLMLTPYLPYPLLTGGQTRSYNLIKRLSALGHQITLFCLIKEAEEKKYVGILEKFCKEIKVFSRSQHPWTFANILRTGFSLYPFLVIRNWAKGEKEAIEEKIRKEKFDLIHAETFYVMPHIPKTDIPILLVEQTIEYMVYKHFADEFKIALVKPLLYIDVLKMKYWELRYWRRAQRVVAMSDDDRQSMLNQLSNLDVDIVPNGVDINYFAEKITNKSQTPIILYLGNFTWLQNREAVEILVKKIWPRIRQKVPSVLLWIVGKGAKDFFARLTSNHVQIEEVDDVRSAYQRATVLVAPIYGGGGTRYKNLEAFASGLPVITTSIGIKGIEAKDGAEVIIRDEQDEIADAVANLLSNNTFYKKISDKAKKMVEQKYNWDPIAKNLSKIYEQLGQK